MSIAFNASDVLRNDASTRELYMNLGLLKVDEYLDCWYALRDNNSITKLGVLFKENSIEKFSPHFEALFRAIESRPMLKALELWSCQYFPVSQVDRLIQSLSRKRRWNMIHFHENGYRYSSASLMLQRLARSSIDVNEFHISLNTTSETCMKNLASVIESKVFKAKKLVLNSYSRPDLVFGALEKAGHIQSLVLNGAWQTIQYPEWIEKVVQASPMRELHLDYEPSPGFGHVLKAASESSNLQVLSIAFTDSRHFHVSNPSGDTVNYRILEGSRVLTLERCGSFSPMML